MIETEEWNLDLNECAASPNAELGIVCEKNGMEEANGLPNENFRESGLKVERETDSLVDDGIERTPTVGNIENVIKIKNKKTVEVKPIDRDVNITRRVLRSGSVAKDPANIDKHHWALEKKSNGTRKGDDMGRISDRNSADEVKEKVKDEHLESPVPRETHGDDFISQIDVEYMADRSDDENCNFEPHGKDVQVKHKRERPRKLQIGSQSDGSEDNLIGIRYVEEEKSEAKLEYMQSSEGNKIHAADFRTQVEAEIKDDISYDKKHNVKPHNKELKVKRKRGRPKKLQISSDSDHSGSYANWNLARSPVLSSQSTVNRLSLKSQRGRPPKTKEMAVGYINKENANCRHGSTLITLDQSMSDSINESRRPKCNYGGKPKGPESNRDNCRGVKSGETDESDCNAKKRLKLRESPLKSQDNNPLIDDETRSVEQQNKKNEAGRQSISESKKMLSDRILQLLLAAGWTVQYRPRNGRDYKDAVYVNPEGKTHWSVTKAYRVYKSFLESSMNDPMKSTTTSGLGLLPEEDIHLLGRKTNKKRCDKGKQRPYWKDKDTNENMVTTKEIGKHTLGGNKMQKRKNGRQKKRKESHGSHNLERIPAPVKKIKREVKHNRKRCALSARSSLEDADSKGNGYILFEGKRTILGWMIDSAIVPLNEKVQCMNCKKTQVHLEGIITKEGIQCNCCDKVFSVLDFEVHSGVKHNQPFKSLYLEGGKSFLQGFLESWNKQSESVLKGFHFVDFGGGDQNDDTCGICGDGGDLICCDGCPSTFHQSCLGIKKFPSDAWFCCYCSCKFCEKVEAANHDTATLSPLLRCRLCEEKYHQACIKEEGMMPDERSTHSFCGKSCQELFEGLQLLIGVKHFLPEGFSWTFLRRFELPPVVSDCDISEKIAYNAKLAVAFSVMDECFSPLVDHRSGVNLLENIVYNFRSNFHRLDYNSFLTAVLERGDELIAVASIRIHGNRLAEMPFIGTRYMYRRQGMCRRLMSGIESALDSLKVDKLVIPAVPELMDTWTSGFGFKPVPETEKKAIKNLNLLVFPGVDMLEKSLVKEQIAEPNVSTSNGYLPLAPEISLPVDVAENKPEESKDSTPEQNCPTADIKSPADPVDTCFKKSKNVEDEDNDTESNLKLLHKSLEEKEKIEKLTEKDVDSLPDVVDSQREYNSGMATDSHTDQTDTKRQENSDDSRGVKPEVIEESDQEFDSCIIGNGEIDKKKEVVSALQISPRLIQRRWVEQKKHTGTIAAVLLDSPNRCV